MPALNGYETLLKINELYSSKKISKKIGIIMVSSLTTEGANITIKALQAGAFEFITKPSQNLDNNNSAEFKKNVIEKISNYINRNNNIANQFKNSTLHIDIEKINRNSKKYQAIAIGVSTGGPQALKALLPELTKITNIPIFVTQHIPVEFSFSLADSLQKYCSHKIHIARENQLIENNNLYFSPGNKNMLVRKTFDSKIKIGLNDSKSENNIVPSVNILFRSMANVYAQNFIAIILTGMGVDGSAGITAVKRAGAYTIAQDKESSVVWGMPGNAIASGNIDSILDLNEIPNFIKNLLEKNNG